MAEVAPAAEVARAADAAQPVLSVRGLQKAFGDFVAVHEASFELEAGASLGLVGESGSGKSTIARMIVGLERAGAGTISCCGRDRSQPARSARERRRRGREAQIVFQDPYSSLDPRQTVAQALEEILRLHSDAPAAERRERVRELAATVALEERQLRALPRALSGGERQRVAIARALCASPRVIILDEAVSALDVSIQAQVLNLLGDIREQTGVAYLLISHDLAVVRHLCEQTIVLQAGRVVERGPTQELLDDPREQYTKLLRASVPGPGWKPVRRGDAAAD